MYKTGRGTYKLSNDALNSQSSTPGGYVSFVAHLWVGDNGKLIRGTIEDVHTGTRLALDLSDLVALLLKSLAHSPGRTQELQDEQEQNVNEERQNEGSEGPSDG